MFNVQIVVKGGGHWLRKTFQLAVVPVEGRTLFVLNRRILLRVKYVTQDLDSGVFEAYCDAERDTLWDLHISNTGCQTNDKHSLAEDPAVIKAVKKRDACAEKIKRECGIP